MSTDGDATRTDDSLNGQLFRVLSDLMTQYVPYNLVVTSVNNDQVDVTYYLDSSKNLIAVNGSGDDLYECSSRPVPIPTT